MGQVVANAKSPDLRAAYKALLRYVETRGPSMTREQTEAIVEIKRRLKRLENDSNRLIRLNNELLDMETPQRHFDEVSDTLTYNFKGVAHSIKFNRADPGTPIRLVGSTSMGAYVAGQPTHDGEATDQLKAVMEQLLEGFYDNAFRITKLVGTLTGRPKFECRRITMVRSKLITHPPEGAIYSFGFSSTGPVVKPIHRGEREWTDDGLVPNVEALREALLDVFARGA